MNEITWKITTGEQSRVPACHGHWGGYNVTKALAWVINVGPASSAWLARCAGQATGPCSFNEAKAAAVTMAKGASGDYTIKEDPVKLLNALAAENVDEAACPHVGQDQRHVGTKDYVDCPRVTGDAGAPLNGGWATMAHGP